MLKYLSSIKKFFVSFLCVFTATVMLFVLLFIDSGTVFAITANDYKNLSWPMSGDTECESGAASTAATSAPGATGNLKSGDHVYILGDSITHGANSEYTTQFGAKQITPHVSAVTSRSWNGAGSPSAGATGTLGPGSQAIVADEGKVKQSAAVIIALGTNGLEGSNPIDEVVAKVNEIKSGIPIYWINVGGTKVPGDLTTFNSALASKASGKYKVIDWAKTLDPTGDGKNDPGSLLGDGVHPNPAGYKKLVELVIATTTAGAATAATPTPTTPAVQGASSGQVLAETTETPAAPAATTKPPIPDNPPVIDNAGVENAKIGPDKLTPVSGVPNVTDVQGGIQIRKELVEPLTKLAAGFKAKFGRNLTVFSGYRDAASQQISVDGAKAKGQPERAAPVGQSSHGWGLAVDLVKEKLWSETGSGPFDSEEYKWLASDGVGMGWKNPYYKGHGGQASEESWHWEYGTVNTWGAGTGGQTAATGAAAAAGNVCCGTSSGGSATATSGTNLELEYKDETRGDRKVGASVYLPSESKPQALVMFAPGRGQNSKPDGFYKRYLKAIAAQGFVVVGANFSDNNSEAAIAKDAEDIKFLIGKVQSEAQLSGKINTAAGVGMVGHSDGGFISMIVGYAEGVKDSRIKVVIAQSGANFGGFSYTSGPPLLGMAGSQDAGNHAAVNNAYQSVGAPYSSFASMVGGDHDQWLVADGSAYKDAADQLTGAMLKRFLANDGSDATKLATVAGKHDKVRFSEKGADNPSGNAESSATPATGDSCACSVGTASLLAGKDNEEKAWNFLVSKGMSTVQAAGSMGNLKAEGNFIPDQLEIAFSPPPHKWDKPLELPVPIGPAGQPGLGIVQWTSVGRKAKLLEAANASPAKSVIDIGVQLEFMWTELSGPYKTAALDPIMKSNDLAEVVKIWQDKYEVGAHFEPRMEAATKFMAKYGSSPTGAVASSSAGPAVACGASGGSGTFTAITGTPEEWRQRILSNANIKWGNAPGISSESEQKEDIKDCLKDVALAGLLAMAEQSGVPVPINTMARGHGGCAGGKSDHNNGKGVDIGYYGNGGQGQANHKPEGDTLYKYLYDNRDGLKVGQLIWQDPPQGYKCINGGQPVECSTYGAGTMNQHYHHIHIGFKE